MGRKKKDYEIWIEEQRKRWEERIKEAEQEKQDEEVNITMSIAKAKDIVSNLNGDTAFENSLKKCIEYQFDDKMNRIIRKIQNQRYCNHKWHTFTKEDLIKCGSPSVWGIEAWSKEEIESFYMERFCKCDKCNMPYKYRNLTDNDFEEIIQDCENNASIKLSGHIILDEIEIWDKKINNLYEW